MASITWGREIAEVYDETYRAGFKPSVLGPMVDLLAGLAHDGPVLEFAAGAGRVALALALHARGAFTHVYLAANTIMNVTSKDDQIAVFATRPPTWNPGCFVVEAIVPQLRRVPGRDRPMFTLDFPHVGIEAFNDLVGTDRLVALLDPNRRVRQLPALPLRLAIQARPHGQDRRLAGMGPVGGLGPGAVHLRKRQPGRGIREAAVRRANVQSRAQINRYGAARSASTGS